MDDNLTHAFFKSPTSSASSLRSFAACSKTSMDYDETTMNDHGHHQNLAPAKSTRCSFAFISLVVSSSFMGLEISALYSTSIVIVNTAWDLLLTAFMLVAPVAMREHSGK